MDKNNKKLYTKEESSLIKFEGVRKVSTAANSAYVTQTAFPAKESAETISAMDYRKRIARKSKSIIGRTFEELYKDGQ